MLFLKQLGTSGVGGLLLACTHVPPCTETSSPVDVKDREAIGFSLKDEVTAYFPFEADVTWQAAADATLAQTSTRLSVQVELANNPEAAFVHSTSGPGLNDQPDEVSSCSDHLRSDVEVSIKTEDGALDEHTVTQLRVFREQEHMLIFFDEPVLKGNYPLAENLGFKGVISGNDGTVDGFALSVVTDRSGPVTKTTGQLLIVGDE